MKLTENEKYDLARRRVKQIKRLIIHILLFAITSGIAFLQMDRYLPDSTNYCLYGISTWGVIVIIHTIVVLMSGTNQIKIMKKIYDDLDK